MPSIQKVPVRPGRIVTLSRGCFRRKGRMLRAPAGLQVRQLRRRVRVHVFLKKDFFGSGYFPQLGNFHLGCCYSHFHMLYYEGTLDGLQQTGRLSSLSGGAILGFVFCFAGDFASARLTFL